MQTFPRFRLTGLALTALLLLAACDSAEERAEGHYQSALALLEEGDEDRAILEFRNVFKLDGLHRDARLTYAEVMRNRGDMQEAFSHYLLLAEQFPEDPLPRKWLFRLAMLGGDYNEAERHGRRALRLDPDDTEVQAIAAIMEYEVAVDDERFAERRAAAARLAELSSELDDPQLFLPTLIDNHIRDAELEEALTGIDQLLEEDAAQENWQNVKLRLLNQLGRGPEVEAQLESMIRLFPAESDYPAALVRWHMAQDQSDKAEGFLRTWSDEAEGDTKTARKAELVAFLSRLRGADVAIKELDTLIEEEESTDQITFQAMQAGLLFDRGDREEAIERMAAILDEAGEEVSEERQEDLNGIEVNLALMLIAVDREAEARTRIAAVLERDDTNVGALKQSSAWLIEADRADEAIVGLRRALSSDPDDPQIMSLIADAHLRNGSRELAGEMLSLADEAANGAPAEAVAYARFLAADRAYRPAEDVLIKALRQSPNNIEVLTLLGRVHIQASDWGRAEQVEARLRRIGTRAAVARADALRVDWLRAQERGQEALRFLTDLADLGRGNVAAEIAVARTHMQNGNYDQAEAFIETRLTEEPRNPEMRMLLAALYAQTSRGDEAERILRILVEEDPTREIVWRTLYETKVRLGEQEEAREILTNALAALPDAPDLLWAKAGQLERDGDFDGAITVYEGLYERLPNSPIIANNLASLLSTHRSEPEAIDRAYSIARRLRGSDVPAFQDTFGWIAHLRGQTDEAIEHLENAAASLPEEPLVQYHLGMAYAADERLEPALERLSLALELFGDDSARPQAASAKVDIASLEAAIAAAEQEKAAESGN